MATKRKPISKKLRFGVLDRDNYTCRYCGQKTPDVVLHIDHVIPVSKGGTNDESNLVTSCAACNLGKGGRIFNRAMNGRQLLSEREMDMTILVALDSVTGKLEVIRHLFKLCKDQEVGASVGSKFIQSLGVYILDFCQNQEIISFVDYREADNKSEQIILKAISYYRIFNPVDPDQFFGEMITALFFMIKAIFWDVHFYARPGIYESDATELIARMTKELTAITRTTN